VEIILNKAVPKLGERGQIVQVADGYARNFLLPRGLAMLATKGARKQAEAMARAEERREQERRAAASARRDQLHGLAVTVRARANAAGGLYGSVSAHEIVKALKETHGVDVDPHLCRLGEPLRELGEATVHFRFYEGVEADVVVNVKAVEGEAPVADAPADAEVTPRAPRPKPIITGGAVKDAE